MMSRSSALRWSGFFVPVSILGISLTVWSQQDAIFIGFFASLLVLSGLLLGGSQGEGE